jgi:type I restriction enzyme S subunit
MSELPKGWITAALQEIAKINPTIDKSVYSDDLEISFVPMPAVEAETGKIDVSQLRKFGDVKKGYTPFLQHDVLFAKITPCMENGKMAVVPALHNDIGFGSTEFHVLRAYEGIATRYLYYFISSKAYRYNAEHNMTGAVGQKRVPTPYIEKSHIPIPPLNEQKRIVAKIEELFSELDKGIESLKAARAQLKVYRQAVFKHAFEGKLTADWRKERKINEWEFISIKKAAEKIVDCLHSTPKFSELGKFCIDSNWIENNKVIFDKARYVSDEIYFERIKRLKPQKDDVLFVREGSKKIGTALVVNFTFDFCLGQRMMLFRLNKNILPQYFVYYIQSDSFKKQYNPLIGGSASPHLNISDIKKMQFPFCDFNEQNEIVQRIEAQTSVIESIAATINAELQKSEALRQSILKKAFSGQLVAQDPADEPASVLLERIRAEKMGQSAKKNPKEKRRGV